jgi:hypothetical protein
VTLVERHSRFAILIKVASEDTAVVVTAWSRHIHYPKTVEYADRFVSLGEKVALGYRLEALTDRALAFLADCGDAAFETPKAYNDADAAAIQGLEAVRQYPLSSDCTYSEPCLAERERTEGLFYSEAKIGDSGLKGVKSSYCADDGVEIRSIRLFTQSPVVSEFNQFRKTRDSHIVPTLYANWYAKRISPPVISCSGSRQIFCWLRPTKGTKKWGQIRSA